MRQTDRPLKGKEKEGGGDVQPFDGSDILFKWSYHNHSYGIPKKVKSDLEKGVDVFLALGDLSQKDSLLERLAGEGIKQKVVTIMIYSHPSEITKRLEARESSEEFLERNQEAEEQIAAYRSRARCADAPRRG